MKNEELKDLKIAGFMTLQGGEFNKVNVSGTIVLTSDVKCEEFIIDGTGEVQGNLKTNTGKIKGTTKFEKDLESKQLIIIGTCKIEGNANIDDLYIKGVCEIDGKVSSLTTKIQGWVTIEKSCESEKFTSIGYVSIGESLNADNIDITLVHKRSNIKEIGGEKITILRGKENLIKKFLHAVRFPLGIFDNTLTAETIEGDDIKLENTTAKVVRGNNVNILSGCKIDRIEYRNIIKISKDAEVREYKKV